jgi:hypothetical protein
MLDYAQSFEEFSSSLKPIDLALYAGIGLVLWVLFKDKLSPVQVLLGSLVDKVKNLLNKKNSVVNSSVTYNTTPLFNKPEVSPEIMLRPSTSKPTKEDLFFKLIVSWKETRDLARSCGCDKAVEVADSMFPYLSPNVCAGENKDA